MFVAKYALGQIQMQIKFAQCLGYFKIRFKLLKR